MKDAYDLQEFNMFIENLQLIAIVLAAILALTFIGFKIYYRKQ